MVIDKSYIRNAGNAALPIIIIMVVGIVCAAGFLFFRISTPPANPPVGSTLKESGKSMYPHVNQNVQKAKEEADAKVEAEVETEKVVMEVELPSPAFVGTPKKIRSDVKVDKSTFGKERGDFLVPKGSKVISRGKPVTGSVQPIVGDLEQVTDGEKEPDQISWIDLDSGKQFITLDLEAMYQLDAILIWHDHRQPEFYRDVIVEVADDAEFTKNVRMLFNNDYDNSYGKGVGEDFEYVEAKEGKLIDPKGIKARYVRLHSNGSTADDQNHYTEVEVWGRAVE